IAAFGIAAVLTGSPERSAVSASDVDSATQALQPTIDGVLRVLADPAMAGATKAAQRQAALRNVMEPVIDFPEAARRALAVHWAPRTEGGGGEPRGQLPRAIQHRDSHE